MAGLLTTLETLDLDQLTGRLERARGAVGGPGAVTLQGFDVRDLLGDVGGLMRAPTTLPASPEAVVGLLESGLSELGQLVQLPDLRLVAEVEEAVREAVAILEAVVERLTASDGGSLLDDILGDLGGLGSLLTDLVGRAVDSLPSEFPESIRLPFTAAAILSGAQPPSAQELAGILSGVVVGIDLDGLAAPARRVDGFTAGLGAAGGDLAPLGAHVTGLTAQLQAATGLLVQAPPDVSGAVAALKPVASGLDTLFGSELPQAIGAVAAGVESLDAAALAVDVERLLDPVLDLIPTVSSDLDESLLGPLRSLHATLDALTPDGITGALAVVRKELSDSVASSDLQEVPQVIDVLFDALVEQLQRVPLRALRDELLDALAGVEARVRDFAGFDPAWAIGEQVQSLQQAIAGIDLSAIQERVQELQQSIQGVLDEFPMAEIRDDLSGLVQTVADALADFTPALDQLSQEVDALADEVRALDLDEAGSASIDVIAGIREQVSDAVGSGDVPEALRPAIAIAAQSLRGLDVSVSITAPFAAAVDEIDPSELLAPIDDALAQVRRTLDSVTPAAVVARLDDPFEQLVHALDALRPAALVAALSHEFQAFLQLVEKLDPRTLAAGLEQAFEHVLDQLRAAADPAPLFAPLHAIYADLQALVDRLDLEKALGGLVEGIAGLPRTFADSMHGSLAANPRAGDAPPLPDGTVFQLGDMLRPISELLAQIREGVEALAEPLLSEALDLVGGPLQTLRRLADPGHGLLVEVARALDQRRALVDPLAQGGPFAELRAAVDVVVVTSASIDVSAGDRAPLDGAVASVRLDGRIEATADARARLDTAGAGLGGSLGDPGLVSALDRLSIALDAGVPATLASQDAAATGAARVAAIFDAIDLHAVVTELDAIGQDVQAKLNGLSKELSGAMARMVDTVFGLLDPVLPDGLLARFHAGMERIHAELSVLDPTPIEQEAREVLDALLAALRAWSPAAIAEELGGVFDALHAKLAELDPATLLGGLDPLGPLIDGFAALKPSTVLAPLVEQTTDIEQALERLTGLTLGESLIDAVATLRAQLELVVADVQHELDTLLDDLGRMSGDASVSASVG